MGGSSSINYMMYVRGNKADYNEWAAQGNTGWDWESVLPFFKKSEQNQNEIVLKQPYAKELHGINGTGIKVTRAKNFDDVFERFLNILHEMDYKILPENNGPEQLGFAYVDFSISGGMRESTYQRYLLPNKNRSNLLILKEAYVTKVIIDPKTKVAKGVEVIVNGKTLDIKASKEVIISAGAIGSPEILLKSGLGPNEVLKNNKICSVTELPVGENFQDHVSVQFIVTGKSNSVSIANKEFYMIQYLYNRSGYLSSGIMPTINGFVNIHDDQSYPDVQYTIFHFLANNTDLKATCSNIFQYNDEICKSIIEINTKTEMIVIAVVLLHPKSKGYITLDDNGKLIVNPNYLKDDEDVKTLTNAIKKILPIVKTPSFQDSNPRVAKLNLKQCNDFIFNSDNYWSCYVRNMASTTMHPTGSCAMGKVVDNELKVHQISKLRVIDGSIMPTTISGNTNAPCIMIGEKVADLIKNQYLHEVTDT